MKKLFGLTILPILLLSSCNQRSLRSDIKEFIASFSLNESIETYKEAGYESSETVLINDKLTTVTETMDFNIKDENNITYSYTHKEYENLELKVDNYASLTTIDGRYYYKSNSIEKEMTSKEVTELIRSFFYKTDNGEIQYHNNGCYYGDIVKDSSLAFQDYITIDNEAHLLTVHYEFYDKKDKATIKQNIVVNSLGMLEENHAEIYTDTASSITDIKVYKVE